MLALFSKHKEKAEHKRYITATGVLSDILAPGLPAVYLYNGKLIRTTVVKSILEAAPNYVQFETQNSIYTLFFAKEPVTSIKLVV